MMTSANDNKYQYLVMATVDGCVWRHWTHLQLLMGLAMVVVGGYGECGLEKDGGGADGGDVLAIVSFLIFN